jgi:hypothetical protein
MIDNASKIIFLLKWYHHKQNWTWNFVLTPKGPSPIFGPFLKFGQAIVDAIFVKIIPNFRWTCGLVLASRRTNFYEIPISSLEAMLQKLNYIEVRAA